MNIEQQVQSLLFSQQHDWPQAAMGFEALKACRYRDFTINGHHFRAQHNPARAVSTGARVDATSIATRKCFLCRCNRHPSQLGLPFLDNRFEILVNPFPIFDSHLTIPCIDHTPQTIVGNYAVMLTLSANLPGFTVFYNGPRCGASAPDHMHFQAGESKSFPIWDWIEHETASAPPVKFRLITSQNPATAESLFLDYLNTLSKPEGESEPMVNILTRFHNAQYQTVVIPRRAHRPRCYTAANNTEGFMISPASVDLAGLFIVPRLLDFQRLDETIIQSIINDVTFT